MRHPDSESVKLHADVEMTGNLFKTCHSGRPSGAQVEGSPEVKGRGELELLAYGVGRVGTLDV